MHINYYVRYMDDGILIHESKEVLNRTRRQAEGAVFVSSKKIIGMARSL